MREKPKWRYTTTGNRAQPNARYATRCWHREPGALSYDRLDREDYPSAGPTANVVRRTESCTSHPWIEFREQPWWFKSAAWSQTRAAGPHVWTKSAKVDTFSPQPRYRFRFKTFLSVVPAVNFGTLLAGIFDQCLSLRLDSAPSFSIRLKHRKTGGKDRSRSLRWKTRSLHCKKLIPVHVLDRLLSPIIPLN